MAEAVILWLKSSRMYQKTMSQVQDSLALNSASVVKQAMRDCSLEDQETALPPMRSTKPVVDLAEAISPAKSASEREANATGEDSICSGACS